MNLLLSSIILCLIGIVWALCVALTIIILVRGYYRAQELKAPLKKQRVIKKECEHFWLPAEIIIYPPKDPHGFDHERGEIIEVKEFYCTRCMTIVDAYEDMEEDED